MTTRLKRFIAAAVQATHKKAHRLRIIWFSLLSDCKNVSGTATCFQPTLMTGAGSIKFGDRVVLGWHPSPYLFSGYMHLEARAANANIIIGANSVLNNNAVLISDGPGIFNGSDCLIGPNFTAFDTDFHTLDPCTRRNGVAKMGAVRLGNNLFIGANVTVLRDTSIGSNSVIGAGSIVRGDFPEYSIISGSPAVAVGSIRYANEESLLAVKMRSTAQ